MYPTRMDIEPDEQGDRLKFLGHMAGGLAHEIKNPLSTININLQLMREDWADPSSAKENRLQKKIGLLLGEVKRLETILDDFLNFARGHIQNPEAVHMNPLLRQVCELMGPEMEQRGCSLRLFEGDTLPVIEADKKSLIQAVMNLLKNAMESIEGEGEILLSSRQIGAWIEIQVTDTGEGIPPESLTKIFNAYYSTKRAGTGLGLPTTRRIIEEHGGTLSVASEVGRGTIFTVKLPAVPALSSGDNMKEDTA